MTLIRVSWDSPLYVMASTELVSGSVISGSMVVEGSRVFLYDTQVWKRINFDNSLVDAYGGASGSYTAAGGEVVTVVDGIITSIA